MEITKSFTLFETRTQPMRRLEIVNHLQCDESDLIDAIHEGVFPRSDYAAMNMSGRWRIKTLLLWELRGGMNQLNQWLRKRICVC